MEQNITAQLILKIRENLTDYFKSLGDIEAVYLFGSYAEGTFNKLSDIDVGIIPKKNHSLELLEVVTKFIKAGYENVDVVIMDVENYLLNYEIVRNNKIIYKTDEFDEISYLVKVSKQYFDFKPYIDMQIEALKERYKKDG